MSERLSNERLAELDRKVYWNAKALCDMAAVPNADLRALVDEVRTYFSHRVSVACTPACCACDVITALDEVRERRAAEARAKRLRSDRAEDPMRTP